MTAQAAELPKRRTGASPPGVPTPVIPLATCYPCVRSTPRRLPRSITSIPAGVPGKVRSGARRALRQPCWAAHPGMRRRRTAARRRMPQPRGGLTQGALAGNRAAAQFLSLPGDPARRVHLTPDQATSTRLDGTARPLARQCYRPARVRALPARRSGPPQRQAAWIGRTRARHQRAPAARRRIGAATAQRSTAPRCSQRPGWRPPAVVAVLAAAVLRSAAAGR